MADRVQRAVAELTDARDTDVFLSYARLDGAMVANELKASLEALDVAVWFDAAEIVPGKSLALQMDGGLAKARAGVAVLTPAFVAGHFWTDRELGSLLKKNTLIPVLHGVTFHDVKGMSGYPPRSRGIRNVAGQHSGHCGQDRQRGEARSGVRPCRRRR